MLAWFAAALLLSLTRLHLKARGMKRTVVLARKLSSGRFTLPAGLRLNTEQAGASVAGAGALFIGRARCLEQSIVLFMLLKLSGVPASLKVGARALPFAAHAWVEVDGNPLNEDSETLANYTTFAI